MAVAPSPGRAPWLAVALAGIGAAYLFLAVRRQWLAEDAFISFRYAKNLVAGHGLRFNAADPEPLEGFSNLGWLLVAAVSEAAGVFPGTTTQVLGALCGLTTLAATWHVARTHLALDRVPSVVALALLATLPPFLCWTTSGLEAMPFALSILLAVVWLAFDDRAWAPLAAAGAMVAAMLLRTEGVYWAPVIAALAAALRHREGRDLRRPLAVFGAAVGLCWLAYSGWRLATFGTLIAHTTTVKTTSVAAPVLLTRGLKYVAVSALTLGIPLLLVPAAALSWRSEQRDRRALVLAMALAFPAWSVVVGGDYMPFFRFLLPSAPFLALGVGFLFQDAATRFGARAAGGAGAALVVLSTLTAGRPLAPIALLASLSFVSGPTTVQDGTFVIEGRTERPLAQEWRVLRKLVEPGETVVLPGVGRNAYYTEATVIDQCGLVRDNSAELAARPAGRRGRQPGHDQCMAATAFVHLEPDILIFTSAAVPEGGDPNRVVRGNVDALMEMKIDRTEHYPTVAEEPFEDVTLYGIAMRKAADPAAAKAGWQAYRKLLRSLRPEG